MKKKKITAKELYKKLLASNVIGKQGVITFNLAGVSIKVDTTDAVGTILQLWVKQWMINNNIYFREQENTQKFPDFFLDENDSNNLLEIKAFNFENTPAFDIANYESYVNSVSENIFHLDTSYIIFGYKMDKNGIITIEKIYFKKIFEIAGDSKEWPLKVQVKRNVIYNIRPNSEFKSNHNGPFNNDESLLNATYETYLKYRGAKQANEWLEKLIKNYEDYYNKKLSIKEKSRYQKKAKKKPKKSSKKR